MKNDNCVDATHAMNPRICRDLAPAVSPNTEEAMDESCLVCGGKVGELHSEWCECKPNCKIGDEEKMMAPNDENHCQKGRVQHGHPDFYVILEEMADLHSRKNHDYAGDDPLSNLRACEEIGMPAWKGVLVRLMDKWGRLKQFAKQGMLEVKDESIIDTLMDNAVYSILCIILMGERGSDEAN